MSPEDRLNRLERFAKRLAVNGRRTRNDLRTNINALIDAQVRNEDQFNDRFARLSAAQDRTDGQIKELRAAQTQTDGQIKELRAAQNQTDGEIKELRAAQTQTDDQIKRSHVLIKELGAAQTQSDERLSVLIEIVERDHKRQR